MPTALNRLPCQCPIEARQADEAVDDRAGGRGFAESHAEQRGDDVQLEGTDQPQFSGPVMTSGAATTSRLRITVLPLVAIRRSRDDVTGCARVLSDPPSEHAASDRSCLCLCGQRTRSVSQLHTPVASANRACWDCGTSRRVRRMGSMAFMCRKVDCRASAVVCTDSTAAWYIDLSVEKVGGRPVAVQREDGLLWAGRVSREVRERETAASRRYIHHRNRPPARPLRPKRVLSRLQSVCAGRSPRSAKYVKRIRWPPCRGSRASSHPAARRHEQLKLQSGAKHGGNPVFLGRDVDLAGGEDRRCAVRPGRTATTHGNTDECADGVGATSRAIALRIVDSASRHAGRQGR